MRMWVIMLLEYLIQLKNEEIQPYMSLGSTKIDDWTEGWVYQGDIFEPEK